MAEKSLSGTPRRIFILLYVCWSIAYLDRVMMNLAAPSIMHDIAISPAQQGLILGIFFLGYSGMQVPGGWLADRFGSRIVIVVGLVAWSSFTLGTGLATSVVALISVRLLFGVGEGIFPPASIKALYEHFPQRSRGGASSALMSANYVGSMIAPLVMLPMLVAIGWRLSFAVLSVVGGLCAIGYFLLAGHKRVPIQGERAAHRADALGIVARIPDVWRLALVWFLISLVNKGLDSWMPTYLLKERSVSAASAGIMLTLPYVAATIGMISGGWVMERFFCDREHHFISANAVMTCLGLYLMYAMHTVGAIVAAETMVYLFKSFAFAAIVALPARFLAQDVIASGFGVINLGGQLAGFVAPIAIGAVLGATASYAMVFLGLMAVCAAAVLLNVAAGRVRAPLSGVAAA